MSANPANWVKLAPQAENLFEVRGAAPKMYSNAQYNYKRTEYCNSYYHALIY